MNPDGSGSWTGTDGSTSSWEAGEIPIANLPGMEGLSNMDSIANSPEAEEAFGKTVMVHRTNIYRKLNVTSQFGLLRIALETGYLDVSDVINEDTLVKTD